MAEVKTAQPVYGAPATPPGGQYIQETPLWVVVVRGFQALFAFIILAMCGYLIHGKALDANVFGLVVGLMTWVVVAYTLVSEKVPGARGLYNIWAVLSLDLLMAIFWLSSMGANAAQRASFIYKVNVDYCYNDGSTVNSNHCVVSKRDLERRAAVANNVGLAVMSAIAGLSALVMLLFIATLVFHGHTFRMYHQAKKSTPSDNATAEMTAQQAPMLAPHQVPAPAHPAYTEYPSQTQPQGYAAPQGYPSPQVYQAQAEYPSQTQPQGYAAQSPYASPTQPQGYPQGYPPTQTYPPTVPSPAPVSTPSPAPHELQGPGQPQQQVASYQLPGSEPYGYPGPNQQQQYYSPHGTPAPGQPYYPPAQQ